MVEHICEQCRENVMVDATTCPHCGYNAGKSEWRSAAVIQIVGLVLTLTVYGAIVGLPLQYWSYKRMESAKEMTVGVSAE